MLIFGNESFDTSESSKLQKTNTMNIDPNHHYQLYTLLGKEKMVLNIFNRGRYSYMPHLVPMADFSGQNWIIEPTEMEQCFRLSTSLFGVNMWLDAIKGGVFDGLLIVVTEENYSGRLWEIKEDKQNENVFKVSTFFHGENKYIDIHKSGDFNNMPYLVDETSSSGQLWRVEKKQGALEYI